MAVSMAQVAWPGFSDLYFADVDSAWCRFHVLESAHSGSAGRRCRVLDCADGESAGHRSRVAAVVLAVDAGALVVSCPWLMSMAFHG